MSNQDLLPPGAAPFQVKPRDVNDVPIVTLTLSSDRYTDFQLRQLGDQVLEDTKKVTGTAGGFVVGGRGRELRVQIDPSRLKAYGLTPLGVANVIQGENLALPAGRFESRNESFLVETGRFIRSKEDLDGLVVGVHEQRPVYLRQVAEVSDGPTEATSYVWHGEPTGKAGGGRRERPMQDTSPYDLTVHASRISAVTVAIAKQAGTNAVTDRAGCRSKSSTS